MPTRVDRSERISKSECRSVSLSTLTPNDGGSTCRSAKRTTNPTFQFGASLGRPSYNHGRKTISSRPNSQKTITSRPSCPNSSLTNIDFSQNLPYQHTLFPLGRKKQVFFTFFNLLFVGRLGVKSKTTTASSPSLAL